MRFVSGLRAVTTRPLTATRTAASIVLIGLVVACSPAVAPSSAAAPTSVPPVAPTSVPAGGPTSVPAAAPAGTIGPLNPTVALKVADQQFVPLAPVYVALERGYFSDQGLAVEMVPIQDTPTIVTQLATGGVAFGELGPDPGLFNTMERGIDVRIVASSSNNRQTDHVATFMVRQDLLDNGRYKGPSDLKGMTVAAPAQQSQFFVARVLAKGGLTMSDINLVTLGVPDIVPAFQNKAIDAAWEVEPLITALESRGVAKTQYTTGELYPDNLGQALAMSPIFAHDHPEAAQRFVVAYLRGLRDYYHALVKQDTDRTAVVQALVAHTAVKDPTLFNVIGVQSVDPNARLDIGKWDVYQDYYLATGNQNNKLDLTRYVDTTFLNAALDQLGRE